MPGLWRHKWCLVNFFIVVDDFVIEYVGKNHTHHLRGFLKEHYTVTEDWSGKKKRHWPQLELPTANFLPLHKILYLQTPHLKFPSRSHQASTISPPPRQNQLRCQILEFYWAFLHPAPWQRRHQALPINGGGLLFYARALNNKLLVALREIGTQQAAATEQTNEAISQLLDYVATYPNDGILYRSSNMILADHSYDVSRNVRKARSSFGAHIMFSENYPVPRHNVPMIHRNKHGRKSRSTASDIVLKNDKTFFSVVIEFLK